MKQVAVINTLDGTITTKGQNDGKIIDKYYTKVNRKLYFRGLLVRKQDSDLVIKLLQEQKSIIDKAREREFQIITIFGDILNSGLNSSTYPDIRNKEWFKQIKPNE